MRRWIPPSLRARLMLLVGVAIVPMLALLVYSSLEERRQAVMEAQEDALGVVRLLISDQERTIEGARQLLRVLAKLPEVRDDDAVVCTARLAELLELYPDYQGFGITNLDGRITCMAPSSVPPIPVTGSAWFKRTLETLTFAIGDYQELPGADAPVLTFAYPIIEDGQLQSVVFALIRLADLNSLAEEAGLSDQATLISIDRNGTVLDRFPQAQEWVGMRLATQPLIRTILAQHEGVTEVAGPDGITRLYAFAPVGSSRVVDSGIYLAVGNSLTTAFAEADQRLIRNLITLSVIAALTIAAAVYLSDRFVMRQMNELVKTTLLLKQGDLGARSSVIPETAELDQLARAFNDMAAALEQREAERKQAEDIIREQRELLRVTLSSIGDGVITTDTQGHITFFNPIAEALTGWTQDEAVGQPLSEVFHIVDETTHDAIENPAMKVLREGATIGLSQNSLLLNENGAEISIDDSGAPIRDDHGDVIGVVLVFRDVSARRRAERRLTIQYNVARILAESDTLSEIFAKVLQAICEGIGWQVGVFWHVDREANVLRHSGSWLDPKLQASDFGSFSEISFAPDFDVPGRVWSARRPAWISDLSVDTQFTRSATALKAGLRSGLALPIYNRQEVLGVLECLTEKLQERDDDLLMMLEALGNQIGNFIERRRVEEALRRSNAELQRAERSQRLLADASRLLVSSLDYETQLNNVAELVVPDLADWCIIDVLEANDAPYDVIAVHVDQQKASLARELRRLFPIDLDAPTGVANVLRSGQSEFYLEISDATLESTTLSAEHLEFVRKLELKSVIIVPLIARHQTLGSLTLMWSVSDKRYTASDVELAEELARRVALALDNAHLYEAEQKTRLNAERSAERIVRLQTLTASLSSALTPTQVADVCVKQTMAALKASAGHVALLPNESREPEWIAHVGYPPGSLERRRRSPAPMTTLSQYAIQHGEALFLESQRQVHSHYPELSMDLASGHNACAVIPLRVEEQTLGVLALSFSEAHTFSAEDREFLQALSGQCAQAIKRAQLYAAEQTARTEAEHTQRRLTILSEASHALLDASANDSRLENVLHLIVPQLADWCSIHLLEVSGAITLVAAAHREAQYTDRIMTLAQRYPLDPDAPSGVPLVLRTRKPEVADKVSEDLLREMADDANHFHSLQELGFESYLIVPLIVHERTLGAMTLVLSDSGRRYTPAELALVEELANRIATFIDNMRLYQEAQRMNAELEQHVAKRTTQLQASNDRLRRQIIERRQAEEALQRTQHRYEELVNVVDGIVWEADAQTFEFQYVSQKAERLLGYPTTRWITEPDFWITHVHPDDREWVIAYSVPAIAENRSHEYEYRMIAEDGHTVWLRNMITVVTRGDRPVKVRGVMTDITERKLAETELAEMQGRMMESREEERLHLAQELHDGPVQDLYGISYQLAGLQDITRKDDRAEHLDTAQQGLNQVIHALRTIMSELRPPSLAPFGLEKAIRSHAQRFQETHPELVLHLHLMPDVQKLPEPMRLALFRIYQQALANIVRHADARRVTIRFYLDDDRATLEIEDDGRGFDAPARWIDLVRQGHLGLAGAAERAEALGGQLRVISAAGQGTKVEVSMPYLQHQDSQGEHHTMAKE